MPDLDTIARFSIAALLFAVVAGPAVVEVVTRTVSQGRVRGSSRRSASRLATYLEAAVVELSE